MANRIVLAFALLLGAVLAGCGDPDSSCTPGCNHKTCGDDGCGGSCGTCSSPARCTQGQCCTPNCAGKTCGDDGCGGTCGTCSIAHTSCLAGNCYCDSGWAPAADANSCLQIGGACAPGMNEGGYCSGSWWVRCDPVHGVAVVECDPQPCRQVSATWGACGCGNLDADGVCWEGPTKVPNEVLFACSPSGVMVAMNCPGLTGGPGAFCSTFVTAYGHQNSCYCQQCSWWNGVSKQCTPQCYSGSSCVYDRGANAHACN